MIEPTDRLYNLLPAIYRVRAPWSNACSLRWS